MKYEDEFREAVEFFLMGLDSVYPEDESIAMTILWTRVGVIDNELLEKIQNKELGIFKPDFFDMDERPRLRLATLSRVTSIPQKEFEDNKPTDFGNEKFRDAADFLRLTKEKYEDAEGPMREIYIRAWVNFHEEAPEELKKELNKKFAEMFGESISQMIPAGTDEEGNQIFPAAEVAKVLGISEEEAIKRASEYKNLGIDVGFFEMPEPDIDKIH